MAPGIGFFHYPGNPVGAGTPSIKSLVSTMPGSVWVPNVLVSIWYACTVAMCVTSWCC